MTKEELKKEIEEYLKQKLEERKDKFVFELPEVYIEDVKEAYLTSAEPREKRIAELEQENKVLAQNLEDTEILNKTYEKRFSDLEKENAELKKENQKWKDGIALKDEEIGCIETDFNTFKSKAKEIIKTFLGFAEAFGYSPSMDRFITEAEQFLKDCEVEK